MTRLTRPLRTLAQHIAAANRAVLADQLEQFYAVLESRGVARTLCQPAWVRYWLKQGKTPTQIVNIAIGPPPRKAPDAHLGGVDA